MSTLTVYPDASDPGTTSTSGMIAATQTTPWSAVRDATAGASVGVVPTQASFIRTAWNGTNYGIKRGFFLFDTSALTSAASISAAVISLAAQGAAGINEDTSTIHVVSSTPASNTTLVVEDFDQVGSTSFGSLAMASWVATDTTYNAFALDANGIANISKTGVSKFATRNSRDFDNSAPTGVNDITCYFSGQAGTTTDPKLVITYTVSAIKTFNGVATASVKTVNGVAIASVKTWNGIA